MFLGVWTHLECEAEVGGVLPAVVVYRRAADRKQRLILGVWTTPEREAEFGGVLPVVG